AGEGDLDLAVGVGAKKFDIAHLDRVHSADRADDPRHDNGAARTPLHRRRVLEIDAGKCRRKSVRVALAADLAVGDDVDAGALHASLSFSRTRPALATAAGLAPWTQTVSIATGIRLPELLMIAPSRTIACTRAAASAGSCNTAPGSLRETRLPVSS